jgi:hypothetical protein
MTLKLQTGWAALARPLMGVLVALPLMVLVVYPFYYLSLPESRQSVADLPQDLLLVLLAEACAVPLFWLCWGGWARTRYWLVTDEGVEVVTRSGPKRKVGWAGVETLRAEGGTVTLLIRGDRRAQRMRFVKAARAREAVQIWQSRNWGIHFAGVPPTPCGCKKETIHHPLRWRKRSHGEVDTEIDPGDHPVRLRRTATEEGNT